MIFAAGFVLYGLVFGLDRVRAAAPPAVIRVACASGLLLYALVGVLCILLGGNFLDYNALRPDAVAGQHLGIWLVELGVGITVAASMISLFYAFAAYKTEVR